MTEQDRSDDEPQDPTLNELAFDLVHQILTATETMRVEPVETKTGAIVLDFGVETTGSLGAGLALSEVCMASLADVNVVAGEVAGVGWPHLYVQTDSPLEACLLSQYAGWKVSVGKFFAMGSGPMRSAAGREELFKDFGYRESAIGVVGVLESGELPGDDVVRYIADKCGITEDKVALLVAPTASIAGNMQIVSRSIETALHKMHALGFDVANVEAACGWAPIPPVAADDFAGIGRTNDAILYGGRVTLWVAGEDENISDIGAQIPSSGSPSYGKPFRDIFEDAGRDFYKIDPNLFSPAEVVIHNVETGKVFVYGKTNHEVLQRSFEF